MATISKDHVETACRPGQGAETCRYLTMGAGWLCAKTDPSLTGAKAVIDERSAEGTMGSKGDNCPGYGVETVVT